MNVLDTIRHLTFVNSVHMIEGEKPTMEDLGLKKYPSAGDRRTEYAPRCISFQQLWTSDEKRNSFRWLLEVKMTWWFIGCEVAIIARGGS